MISAFKMVHRRGCYFSSRRFSSKDQKVTPAWFSDDPNKISDHISLAHLLWSQVIQKGEIAIDATAGNGFDALVLSKIVLSSNSGRLYCMDIQERAIKATEDKLIQAYDSTYVKERVQMMQSSHERFPVEIAANTVSGIVYNLGYLPGTHTDGSKRIMTTPFSTILSMKNALPLLRKGGILTATAYRGHKEGIEETEACFKFFSGLNQTDWRVYSHDPINSETGAVLFSIYKR
jgi:hypothetical protein